MLSDYILEHPAYKYAEDVVSGEIVAGKYVVKQCQYFLDDIHDQESKYFFDEDTLMLIDDFLQLVRMADGHREGMSAYDSLVGFQWFFIANTLAWKMKSNPNKRRYQKSVLLIARKNGKTFLVGLIFILLLLLEPDYSEFYSVAPDKQLSTIVKTEMGKMIDKSPDISDVFDVLASEIRCSPNKSKMVPLANSDGRLDGKQLVKISAVFKSSNIGENLLIF